MKKDTGQSIGNVERASLREVAAVLGKSASAVSKWQGLPRAEQGTGKGKRVYYSIPEVIEHLAQRREAEAVAKRDREVKKQLAGDEPDLEEGDSPGLERFRLARARMAEMDLAVREGELLEANAMARAGYGLESVIRQAGEVLQRDYGAGALEIVNEALRDYRQILVDAIGKEPDSGTD